MLSPATSRVYLAIGSTDMRKAINGLSIMVEQHLSKDPSKSEAVSLYLRICRGWMLFMICRKKKSTVIAGLH